jgi:TatD DNase family protein
MLVDSHCHLNRIDLTEFDQDLNLVLQKAREAGVGHFLSVCVELDEFPVLKELANTHEDISISVGVHPNDAPSAPITSEMLSQLAIAPGCIAIGETGLDYYRVTTEEAQELQRNQFREHIRAAIHSKKPLIIHTRQAAEDTLKVMKEEQAHIIGGVMHCFSEDLDIAKRAMDLNFYISFSGIVTFNNAKTLHEVAKAVPLDRILIETDSPYLAPVPFRGKQNHPALVTHVAERLATLKGLDYETIAATTTANFYTCFRLDA